MVPPPYAKAAVPRAKLAPEPGGSSAPAIVGAIFGLCFALVLIRWCRRRRFYRKVQRTMDEEELAFQKSLAKNYSEEMAELDQNERERLKLLENYMDTMGASLSADDAKDGDLENVEAFLEQLSKTAAGIEAAPGAARAGAPAAAVEWREVK